MQSDYTHLRDLMPACHDVFPKAVHFADLCDKVAGRDDATVRFQMQVLEDDGFVEDEKLEATIGGPKHSAVWFIRLSHPLAANRFLNPQPDGPAD